MTKTISFLLSRKLANDAIPFRGRAADRTALWTLQPAYRSSMPRKNQSHTTVGSGLSPSTIGAAQSWSEIAHGAPDALRPAHSGGNSVGHPPPPLPHFPGPPAMTPCQKVTLGMTRGACMRAKIQCNWPFRTCDFTFVRINYQAFRPRPSQWRPGGSRTLRLSTVSWGSRGHLETES